MEVLEQVLPHGTKIPVDVVVEKHLVQNLETTGICYKDGVRGETLEEMSMKLSLTELYSLVGENKGINFYYEQIPGIIVTVGFTREEDIIDDEEPSNDQQVH
jgi:hypothetical protein